MRVSLIQKPYDVLLLLLFFTAISLPCFKGVLTPDAEWSDTEKRSLIKLPDPPQTMEDIVPFFGELEKYYNDHFGFRETLIFRYHREMEKRFGMAGTPLVLMGEGKWLFFTADELLEDHLGKLRLSNNELDEWYEEQVWRQQWLSKRGVDYLTFSPPNKQTLYNEKMPEEYRKGTEKTRIEQLHDYLNKRPNPFYINVHEAMMEAKPQRKLYFARDTHWNDYGAYVCFREVMKKIEYLYPLERFVTEFLFYKNYFRAFGGDLAQMMMVDKKSFETRPRLHPRKYCSQEADFLAQFPDIGKKVHGKALLMKCEKASLKAIIFCDSFINRLAPFISENFGEVLYLYKGYDQRNVEELLETFTPDIIIEERVERNYFRDFEQYKP